VQRLHNLELAGCIEDAISTSDSDSVETRSKVVQNQMCDSVVNQSGVDSCPDLNSAQNGSVDSSSASNGGEPTSSIYRSRSGRVIKPKPKLDL
jgi:hypothetical protein